MQLYRQRLHEILDWLRFETETIDFYTKYSIGCAPFRDALL